MSVFDMFDKLDDIVYKPVEAVCDWIKEPLRKWEHARNMDSNKLDIQREKEMQELEAKLEREREDHAAELQFRRENWDVEIRAMIAEQEDARRDKLVEAIKNYQIQLADATRDIVESIGKMSIDLRVRANDMVQEKTRAYMKIQDDVRMQSRKELKEVKDEFFENDPDTYRILVEDILQERRTMINTAGKFITELSEDLKRLNRNTDVLMQQGMEAIGSYLKPLADAMGGAVNSDICPEQRIEDTEQSEGDTVDTYFTEV